MRYHIEQIFKLDYAQYQGRNTDEAPGLKSAFNDFENDISPLALKEGLLTESSIGHGSISKVPWVRVYDGSVAPSAKNGVYIVYLFSKNGNAVFLTLNQGVEKAKKESIEETKRLIQQQVVDCKDFVPCKEKIEELGKYKNSTIFYKRYNGSFLPSEEELQKDLMLLLMIYKEYLRNSSNAVNAESRQERAIEPPVQTPNHEKKMTAANINKENYHNSFIQKILFGAPGTGKSFKIDDAERGYGLKDFDESRKFRTTFHPDYDYAQFVGAYKPKKDDKDEKITYAFIPQVFAKAYVTAWKLYFSAGNASTAENQVYLVIEEINRGNCAQIFGDIFQLLDRSNEDDEKGVSQYSIDADCDFAEWLKKYSDLSLDSFWAEYTKKLGGEGKLKLPPNLNILATMNTSDQSLFPMDSAFKRRFDWEYVPISFDGKEAAKYEIDVLDSKGNRYLWKDFVETVNEKILNLTESED